MTPFMFCCPATGKFVEAMRSKDEPEPTAGNETFIGVECLACGRFHLVNPVTGKVLNQGGR